MLLVSQGHELKTEQGAKLGDCGFKSSGTGEVLVRIFPRSDIHVAMQREAAVHLVRLLERYNWSISEADKQSDRWRKFWPKISRIERSLVVMFVTSANGQFRGAVDLRGLPPEVAAVAGDRQMVKIDPAVAREFASLRHIFECSLLTQEDVKFDWWHHHKTVMEVHEQAVMIALRSWWEGEGVHDLDDLLRAALFSDGMRAEEANRVGVDMSLDTEQLIRQRGDLQDGGDSPIRQ